MLLYIHIIFSSKAAQSVIKLDRIMYNLTHMTNAQKKTIILSRVSAFFTDTDTKKKSQSGT